MTPHRRSFREANGKRRHQSAVAVTLLKEPVAFQWLAHDPVKNIDNSGKKSEPRSKRTKSPGPVRRDTKEGLASSVIVPLSGCCQSRCPRLSDKAHQSLDILRRCCQEELVPNELHAS